VTDTTLVSGGNINFTFGVGLAVVDPLAKFKEHSFIIPEILKRGG